MLESLPMMIDVTENKRVELKVVTRGTDGDKRDGRVAIAREVNREVNI